MHRRQRTRQPHGHARRAEQRKRTTFVSEGNGYSDAAEDACGLIKKALLPQRFVSLALNECKACPCPTLQVTTLLFLVFAASSSTTPVGCKSSVHAVEKVKSQELGVRSEQSEAKRGLLAPVQKGLESAFSSAAPTQTVFCRRLPPSYT